MFCPSRRLAADDPLLLARVRAAQKLLHRRALVAAAAGAVPLPGFDWAVDAALLTHLVPAINAEFGLTPEQLDRLPESKRERLQKAISMVGSMLVGKFITQDLVLRAATALGLRLSAGQAVKLVPIAGQAVSALIGYATVRALGEAHIRDCVEIVRIAKVALPAPADAGAAQASQVPPGHAATS